MSSGAVLKADKDFTKEADAAIPEAEKLGSVCEAVHMIRDKR
jgi:26S proteasome regulatory subunit N5